MKKNFLITFVFFVAFAMTVHAFAQSTKERRDAQRKQASADAKEVEEKLKTEQEAQRKRVSDRIEEKKKEDTTILADGMQEVFRRKQSLDDFNKSNRSRHGAVQNKKTLCVEFADKCVIEEDFDVILSDSDEDDIYVVFQECVRSDVDESAILHNTNAKANDSVVHKTLEEKTHDALLALSFPVTENQISSVNKRTNDSLQNELGDIVQETITDIVFGDFIDIHESCFSDRKNWQDCTKDVGIATLGIVPVAKIATVGLRVFKASKKTIKNGKSIVARSSKVIDNFIGQNAKKIQNGVYESESISKDGKLIKRRVEIAVNKKDKDRVIQEIKNPVNTGKRIDKANKTDMYHRFPDITDNYASQAERFPIELKNPGGKTSRQGTLYQVKGKYDEKNGIFEWIVNDKNDITHRRFIPDGKVTGIPNQTP